ncbi:pentapeptide repeat-containing protein [Dictyobacter formicarum]|uniref:Pentapeptide repeat-containing protein n=1 Tax=Dictyobacter formicarum TaxID=2778368 RepID=A0ABQ3VHL0_9CHLR|nr:pentapeptide repeat-containing protein [Dictyobacter formicarum]GHO85194.1 hypothetical protein KSZ_32000 [Dictyobacter formicarum]
MLNTSPTHQVLLLPQVRNPLLLPEPLPDPNKFPDMVSYSEEWRKYTNRYFAAEVDFWTTLDDARDAYNTITSRIIDYPRTHWHGTYDAYLTYNVIISKKEKEQLKQPSDAWLAYFYVWIGHFHAWWCICGQPWRTEPEVNDTRRRELEGWRIAPSDINRGLYPFRNRSMNRADVEYLLITHALPIMPPNKDVASDKQQVKWIEVLENWSPLSPGQSKRGLDLRGANLEKADLRRLPLTELRGGLSGDEWNTAGDKEKDAAAINLEGAYLQRACLQAASLRGANLKNAHLNDAVLKQAALDGAHLDGADLRSVYFDHATSLQHVTLDERTRVANIYWDDVNLEGVRKWPLKLGDETEAEEVKKRGQGKNKEKETLEAYQEAASANHQLAVALRDQGLNKASDYFAYRAEINQLQVRKFQVGAEISQLNKPQLNGTWLSKLMSQPQNQLKNQEFILDKYWLYILNTVGVVFLALALIFAVLGNHKFVHEINLVSLIVGVLSVIPLIIYLFKENVNFRLMVTFMITSIMSIIVFLLVPMLLTWTVLYLKQGTLFILVIVVFCYIAVQQRAQQFIGTIRDFRDMIWSDILDFQQDTKPLFAFLKIQVDYGRYLFSLFLDILIGYGYKPLRGFFWYLFIITTFAVAYQLLGPDKLPQLFPNAFVLSLVSFHGRGLFPGLDQITLGHPLTMLAALEATIGLLIEVSFIATFTQRFFGK